MSVGFGSTIVVCTSFSLLGETGDRTVRLTTLVVSSNSVLELILRSANDEGFSALTGTSTTVRTGSRSDRDAASEPLLSPSTEGLLPARSSLTRDSVLPGSTEEVESKLSLEPLLSLSTKGDCTFPTEARRGGSTTDVWGLAVKMDSLSDKASLEGLRETVVLTVLVSVDVTSVVVLMFRRYCFLELPPSSSTDRTVVEDVPSCCSFFCFFRSSFDRFFRSSSEFELDPELVDDLLFLQIQIRQLRYRIFVLYYRSDQLIINSDEVTFQ